MAHLVADAKPMAEQPGLERAVSASGLFLPAAQPSLCYPPVRANAPASGSKNEKGDKTKRGTGKRKGGQENKNGDRKTERGT